MFRNLLYPAVFVVGLIAVCWVGAGYVGTNTLALSVALLIGACYCAGGLELHRYRQATATLERALAGLSAPPADLSEWLGRLHPSLRNAARLRIEGERVALPAPALTPYLVGLLVLLGMLGTLLGMMTTLRGTGLALESAADLQAIRESIAAPVAGLGFAFGTSIAGVAASAMLGLLSALSRRERGQAAQRLDVAIATTLRAHSQTHRREEAFKLLQRQADMMPALVDRLQEMTAAMERQNLLAHERQTARQDAFHDKTEAVFAQLAASVQRSLQDSIGESARVAGAALQPIMQTTMAAIADETRSLQATVSGAVQQQMDGLSAGFATTTTRVAEIWSEALVDQRRCNEALAQDLGKTLDGFTARFDQGAAGLLDTVSARFDTTAGHAVEAWDSALSRQLSAHQDMAAENQQAQLAAAQAWNEALSQQLSANEAMAARNQQALAAAAATFESHAASLIRTSEQSHAQLQATLESRDEQRLAAWTGAFDSMAASLGERWEHSGEQAAQTQREICDTLARTAQEITAQSQAQAQDTIAEISRLLDAASQAPKAAAEVVAELRQKLSDSMVRDTAMLDERNRLLATLETLLGAVNHASTEQRVAVDALVVTSADLLDRVGTRFTDHIEAETGKLGTAAAQISVGAIEVASLSDAFAAAVQQFGESNELLTARLQGVETALDKSLARSDEQLAYYVAQAKEVIDLSMLSQKQIIQDIQQLAQPPAAAGAQAA
ncbi:MULTISPECIES: DUF802 domain-containing protein [unclassified Lysobacter]|uniref:DUF802 domain-containing protein n=1 Tax=unclassified Lysobacter TaxID=2635362 RepID=UPI001BEB354D|nr:MULTISPECIES: DUF802 domain-containing protein [unclassified Lysobacter]MBT2747690.1 DUF802 domain-containing protein [Lysobacter sp. ISL-42]MBT2752829.1 DUF802 domain-containing protein [Lysobacter sp. ISL-50]MBT2779713.1 DUF802 domain-containing protein [Lysobacter sp. ISL-54]MBT2780108.1 DUF802 domain-containing protein [Lysobacter sp. ISL-52]